ncbi:neutral alpha-glucosidase C [Protopterus annectens]|uniref:neutral alpha-glucosidase C n=1 Tax=Protopterus annectens TaxID=7888 RepID=UPI001CF93091|nr:neutral alpha-glucosidase C [Protopterus annectens]
MEPEHEAQVEECSATEETAQYKTCNDIAFYRRQKLLKSGNCLFHARLDTLSLSGNEAKFQIFNADTKVFLLVEVYSIVGNVVRIKINELAPLKPRYEVPDVLVKEPLTQRLIVLEKDENSITLSPGENGPQILITAKPFQLDISLQQELVLSVNSLGLLYFEHLQPKPEQKTSAETNESSAAKSEKEADNDLGLWEEKFNAFCDTKLSGPTSVGLDFSLHGYEHVYGIPQHAETFQLKPTEDEEPYRLFNLDVFGHKLHSPLGIYGSVPLILAHKPKKTAGIFWLNASETLVDISQRAVAKPLTIGIHQDVKKVRPEPQTDVRWMSESGIIDAFLLLGPSTYDIFKQYAQLTGTQALPSLFSLGYHQCRYSYDDQADVEQVDAGFDEHDIPYDTIWLDIDHTRGNRYFTWDKTKFPNPKRLQQRLKSKKRKLVVISDPHVKVDEKYYIYSQAKARDFFVKDSTGEDFIGLCWPGESCYLDVTNPLARDWYADQYSFKRYECSSDVLYLWNDMNEPSVFKGPEQSLPRNVLHHGGWENRDLHNLYGFYQQMATADGLSRRSAEKERPFVLTRSFFAGSQRYGAMWTGDNMAEWGFLKISIPMLLSISISGISFCGADVGGFFGDPEPELLVRWYQAGAYQPFFRGHSHTESKRREPWLLGEENTKLIRNVIQERYLLLPYWYTIFYEAHVTAKPVMRPLWVEFPEDVDTFGVEDEYLVGNALLVHPVTDAEATAVTILFPGSGEVWYDVKTFQRLQARQTMTVSVTMENIPVFQRGGTVIPKKTKVGKSSGWMSEVPYALQVALDSKNSATGELFLDDGHSFAYQASNQFLYRKFHFHNGVLSSSCADDRGKYKTKCVVEMVLIVGMKASPSSVMVCYSDGTEKVIPFKYDAKTCVLTLENLVLNVGNDWKVKFS